MSKKIMALVLALAMVFSTITVAFAEEPVAEAVAEEVAEVAEVSAEAKALGTIGMLEGAGDGLTAEYTATELNRLTAAIMILKLKGLYEDALKYDGVNNFVDAEELKWEDGKKVLAYLKDNPTVGFGGNEKGEFNPNGTLSEQMLYKVLLENLGYKQVTADVADGDFAWEETLEFAEELGLKPAKAEKFTVDGLSKAVVAALKTNIKGGKAWIEVLVENGKVDEGKAVVAGLMEEAPAVTAALKSAKAIGNSVVEVEFDAEINEGAEDVALYAIEGLEVKAATVAGEKVVRLETAAMTAGKLYNLAVGEVKVKFTGIAKVTGAPSLKTVVSEDVEEVVVTFDKVMDFETAIDVANYTIAGVEVVEAEVDGKDVTLTTNGLVARKQYTVKVTNVKSVDGGLLKSASKSFYTRPDTTAPVVDDVKAETNQRVIVLFNEKVTKDSAENLENYTITTGSTELAVLEAKLVTTGDDKNKKVELTTEVQKASAKYEIKIENITDTTKAANTMKKAVKKTFYGLREDKEAPTFTGAKAISRNHIEVSFTDSSRFDEASVLDVNNYTLTKSDTSKDDVAVNNAEKISFADKTFKVLLTVDDLLVNKSYSLKIESIADEFGNAMSKAITRTINVTRDSVASATVKKVETTKVDKIVVTFDKPLKEASAEDLANYTIDNDIDTPLSAEYDSDDYTVTLETADLTLNEIYKLTIDGVEDLAGNVLKLEPKFRAVIGEKDTDAPELTAVYSIDQKVVVAVFSEAVEFTPGTTKLVLEDNSVTKILIAKLLVDDDTVIEFSADDEDNELVANTEYTIDKDNSFEGITDASPQANPLDKTSIKDEYRVYGNSANYEPAEILSISQIDGVTFEVVFSREINKTQTGIALDGFTVKVDKDDNKIVTLTTTSDKIVDGNKYYVNMASLLDYHGVSAKNVKGVKPDKTELYGEYKDDESPYILDVRAKDRMTVEVEYNEVLQAPSGKPYLIKYADDSVSKSNIGYTLSYTSGKKVVKLLLDTPIEGRYDYVLEITSTPVKDLAGNSAEEKAKETFYFTGSDLAPLGSDDVATADLKAAKAAVEALFVDYTTKKEIKNSVDQAAIYAAEAKVDLLADDVAPDTTKAGLVSDIAKAQGILDAEEGNAAAVDAKIEALPAVDELTLLDDKSKVEEAREAYDALTAREKALVTKLEELKAAEAKIAELEAEADASVKSVKVKTVVATVDDSVETVYNVELAAGTVLAELLPADVVVTPTNADATAGAATTSDGGVTWTVVVTAKDGTTTETYTINVTVAVEP